MKNEFSMDGDFTLEDLKRLVVILHDHKDDSIEVTKIVKFSFSIEITYCKVIEVTNEN